MRKSSLIILILLFLIPIGAQEVSAARLWSSGCELQGDSGGAAIANLEFSNQSAPFAGAIDTTTKRSGLSSCRADHDPAPSFTRFNLGFAVTATTTDLYARAYINIGTISTTTSADNVNKMIWFWDNGIDGQEGGVGLNTDGTVSWVDDDYTVVATGATVLTTGTWYLFEVNYDSADGWEVKINGVSEISGGAHDGDAVDSVAFGLCDDGGGTLCTGDIYFDDLALNNNDGTTQTGYPGVGSIVHMQPNDAGDADANCLAGNWDEVDEITPDDATTICVFDLAGDILDVNVESASDAGIDSFDTVTLVQVGDRAAAATAASMSHNVRLKSAAADTTLSGATIANAATAYNTNDDTIGNRIYHLTSYTDPTTTVAWTPTGTNSLDNMQIGANIVDAAPDMNLSTLWALVEYVDGAPPAGASTVNASRYIINGSSYVKDGSLYLKN